MIRYKFRLPVLLFILSLLLQLNAAGKPFLKMDTVSLQQKIEVPNKVFEEYKKSKKFNYSTESPNPSFLNQLLNDLNRWLGFSVISRIAPFIVYVILILAFVVLILVIFRSKFQGIFYQNPGEPGLNIAANEIAENIDFETLLNNSLQQKKYNLAIRYLYLMLLRQLHQKKLITYKIGKTNYEYLNEIKQKDIIPLFRSATHNYEYVWYGQFQLDQIAYEDIASDYQNLIRKIDD